MASESHHLAQLNIARLRFPRGAPELRSYEAYLARLMPLAEGWPGFLWIHDDSILALAEEAFGPQIAANLSLWSDIDALEAFMTSGPHREAIAQRDNWFVPMDEASFVLWWLPAGALPSFQEACERLAKLRFEGPTAEAFNLERRFGSVPPSSKSGYPPPGTCR